MRQPIGVRRILKRDGQVIEEDGHGLLERYAVLANVGLRLRVVPFELSDAHGRQWLSRWPDG